MAIAQAPPIGFLPGMVAMNPAPSGHWARAEDARPNTQETFEDVPRGKQGALNSYRHAGAALLRSLQTFNKSADSGMPCWTHNTYEGSMGSISQILSTSPGSVNFSDGGMPGSLFPALASQDPTADALFMNAPSAALGLLVAPTDQTPTEVQAPAACREAGDKDDQADHRASTDYGTQADHSHELFWADRQSRSNPTSLPNSRPVSRQVSQGSLKTAPVVIELEDPFTIATPTDSTVPTPSGAAPLGGILDPRAGIKAAQPGGARSSFAHNLEALAPVLHLSQLITEQEIDLVPASSAERHSSTVARGAASSALASKEMYNGTNAAPPCWQNRGADAAGGCSVCSTAAPPSLQGSALVLGSSITTSAPGSLIVPGGTDARGGIVGDASRAAELLMTKFGTAEMPSKGSALHAWGVCKPCAFVFQDGCANGLECEFCHLCEPGERKRRKKERRKIAANWKLRYGG